MAVRGRGLGRTVGRLLLERIEDRGSAVRFSVTPSLVIRRTTAAPGGQARAASPAEPQ